ncbi:uncharacterized protein LOC127846366 [Dreissena polymorpha]|uniref:Uncharacterized protein n=1 Tax=Dreissena polymorpha TaxID=45954 RepID=A0A9D4EEK5_DREPO|nr:uncharacterized protein LOC127846366 [Dreissena polymorpha]XP_052233531.1 uncharacterized protein LOC127846366 [Dreissena polymorpha]XP_052233532.1 uncharacterized protein LOC127846366 [Dreissena polymorpha]XP_052233533.1 uncharacterized protein LOC127846366 [Dreissena polymorpha]XP_052233534.1 uncharacterized protein LOC127846366 [Dreissena polymorpha]XP_052233535.1 uncharacterized protein LOC127846366 [Dreissena polymorpha]XP_052233536.1 uncharacterized protein LOC127846366 [Dreissena po
MENNANAPLVNRDDHSVDTYPTLDMPALFDSNASLADHQIANLSLEDQQLHIHLDANLDTAQQPPTVTAIQSGFMASPEPDHTHDDTVPRRFGVALDNTPVPATRNTRPGEWSNLDESSLKARHNSYQIQRNTTEDRPNGHPENLGQPAHMPNGQPGNLGQPVCRPYRQPGNLGQPAFRPNGQPGNLGQPACMPNGQPGNLGQPAYRPMGQPGNLGQPVCMPNGQPGNLGQPVWRPNGQPGNLGQPVFRPNGQPGNLGQPDYRPMGQPEILGQSSVLHRLESTVSVNQNPTGRSNSQPHGTSETQRDHSGAAVAGAATPLVFSHQHADGSLTPLEYSPSSNLSIQIGNHNHTVINENGLRPSS